MRFVCFSSGAQRRYRDDIIRAMGMPAGCEITFRYRRKYISTGVLELLGKPSLQAAEVLICYLDQSDRSKPVDFIPIRLAVLLDAPIIGDFVVLRMRVQQFTFSADIELFNRELGLRSGELPKWPSDEKAQYASGAFWVAVNDYPKSVVESTSIADWQATVGQLLMRKDFAGTGAFYQIVRLQDLQSTAAVNMTDGQYALRPGREYEVLIDHFLPNDTAETCQMEVALSGSALAFITGSAFQIDSPYDRHWLRFKTQEPLRDERAVLTVKKKVASEDAAVQFDLPIQVAGRVLRAVLMGIVVGLLLAIPQITAVWINPGFGEKSPGWMVKDTSSTATVPPR